MKRACPVVLLALLGCDAPAAPADASRAGGALGAGVVARVGSTSITRAEVERAARDARIPPELALRRLEDEALLAAAAERFESDPEVRRVTRQAAVQALLAAEVEARVGLDRVDEALVERQLEESLARFERPERRGSTHLLIPVDEGEEDASARAYVESVVARLGAAEAGDGSEGAERALAALRAIASEPGPSDRRVEDVPPLARTDAAAPEYLDALFERSAPGPVGRAVRSRFGWHAIVLTDIARRWEASREEALATLRAERLAELRAAALGRLIERLAGETRVELRAEAIELLAPVTEGGEP
ncbi:MAG: hypothetical protein IT378_24200 [Sandaracinaceae bacterium]|nr:hypothetical protein [Sandaracinaceae bacterium]